VYAHATVYDIADTVHPLAGNGNITTDGALGVLSSSNILSWDLTVSGYITPLTLTPSNSALTRRSVFRQIHNALGGAAVERSVQK
jgi:hypothetical protein